MAANRFKQELAGTLLRNKLGALLAKLSESYVSGDHEGHEDLQDEFVQRMKEFTDEPFSPFFKGAHVRPGDYPDLDIYDGEMENLANDLFLLATETKNIQDIMVANFNMISRQEDQVKEGIKRIRSSLGDLKLYGTGALSENIYFSDSFGTLDKVDAETPLLSKPQAAVQPAEGIATLKFGQSDVQRAKIFKLQINDASNGVLGNRTETRLITHADTEAATDGNPDTWFEYEKSFVSSERRAFTDFAGGPLVLDMTAILQKESIINRIVVNPNNFGTKNWIKIRNIETSRNGETYKSIFDDIPQAEWTVDERGALLSLAPEGSKFAGIGVYTFLPRKVRYIRIILEQDKFYGTANWKRQE